LDDPTPPLLTNLDEYLRVFISTPKKIELGFFSKGYFIFVALIGTIRVDASAAA